MSVPDLQRPPISSDEIFEKRYERRASNYKDLSEEFVLPGVSTRSYGIQYSHIYFTRLTRMKPRLIKAAKNRWGENCKIIKELKDLEIGLPCVVIGTIFKKLSLRVNILREFSEKHKLMPQPTRAKYSAVNDELVLEDAIQRITLSGNLSPHLLVTGIVVALLGEESDNGRFNVKEVCFAGTPVVKVPPPVINVDRYVVLISGLNIGSSWCDRTTIQMMIDFLAGQIGGDQDNHMCSSIVRVIVAGNSLTDAPFKSDSDKENKVRFTSRNYTADTVEAMTEFDQILSQLTSSVSCDLMSGSHDPCNHQLPHQPLHKCMFPNSSLSGLNRVTNPYYCSIDKIRFLGTSGENIHDIARCAEETDPLTILGSTLEWNHMVPTAPDTIGCYPFKGKDPFIIDDCPQVYFAGNQQAYQHKLTKDGSSEHPVLLVCIPSFELTHSIVMVNLRTLESEEVCFSTSLSLKHNPRLVADNVGAAQDTDLLQELDSDDDM